MSVFCVPNSGNRKLGLGWGVTYRPVGPTCPGGCPLLGNGCYAERGRVSLHAVRAGKAKAGDDLRRLDGQGRVRWDVSGDNLRPDGRVDRAYLLAKYRWHRRNLGAISLGYTHAPRELAAAGYGPETFPDGFNLLASCHSAEDARALRAEGWRTARVVADDAAELDRGERLCPYDAAKFRRTKSGVTCATCRLCWGPEHQDKSIVFIEF